MTSMSWPEAYGIDIMGDFPVVITSVHENSLAHKDGVLPGDEILDIKKKDVFLFIKNQVIEITRKSSSEQLMLISKIKKICLKNKNLKKKGTFGLWLKGGFPVYVSSVLNDSSASKAGVCAGDVLLQVNNVYVANTPFQEVQELVEKSLSKLKLLLISRSLKIEESKVFSAALKTLHNMHATHLMFNSEKRRKVVQALEGYLHHKDISNFVSDICLILSSDEDRKLIKKLRALIQIEDRAKFDLLLKFHSTGTRIKYVQLHRTVESMSLGIILSESKPVSIHSVITGSPAAIAGLIAGDRLLEINNIDIRSLSYQNVVDLLINSGPDPLLCIYSGISDKIKNSITTKLVAKEFKEQLVMRLSVQDQLFVKETLMNYIKNRNMGMMFDSLKKVIDAPHKTQLIFYIGQILPHCDHPLFERYASEFLMSQAEQEKSMQIKTKQIKCEHNNLVQPLNKSRDNQSIWVSPCNLLTSEQSCCPEEKNFFTDYVLNNTSAEHIKRASKDCLYQYLSPKTPSKPINKSSEMFSKYKFPLEIHEFLPPDLIDSETFEYPLPPNETPPESPREFAVLSGLSKKKAPANYSLKHGPSSKSFQSDFLSGTLQHVPQLIPKNHGSSPSSLHHHQTFYSEAKNDDEDKKNMQIAGKESLPLTPTTSPLKVFLPIPSPPPIYTGSVDINQQNSSILKPLFMKRIDWELLPKSKIENTVWAELAQEPGSARSEINFDELKKLFGRKIEAEKSEKKSLDLRSSTILSSKKELNIGIFLGHLKISVEDIYQLVLNVDHSKFSTSHIETMISCFPDDNEVQELKSNNLTLDKLNVADRFSKKMLEIPLYKERLNFMHFEMEFEEKVERLISSIDVVLKACKEVRESKRLRKILELILTTGNYINQSTVKLPNSTGLIKMPTANGFKISFLSKLISTKTSDSKSTLLHVMVGNLLKKKPLVLEIHEELSSVPLAAKVCSQMVKKETEEIKCGMKEIENIVSENSYEDQFVRAIIQFSDKAYKSFHELLTSYTRMQCEFQELVEFFGDDFTKVTTEDFFGSFAIFLQHIATTKSLLLQKEKVEGSNPNILKESPEIWNPSSNLKQEEKILDKIEIKIPTSSSDESGSDIGEFCNDCNSPHKQRKAKELIDNQELTKEINSELHNMDCNSDTNHDSYIMKTSSFTSDEESVEFVCLKEIKTNRKSVVKRAAVADLDSVSNFKNDEACDNYEIVYTAVKSVPAKSHRDSKEEGKGVESKKKVNIAANNIKVSDMDADKFSIGGIAAKLSTVPMNGSLSRGTMKQAPPLTTNAWPVAVSINPDGEDSHQELDKFEADFRIIENSAFKENRVLNDEEKLFIMDENKAKDSPVSSSTVVETCSDSMTVHSDISNGSSAGHLALKKAVAISPLPWVSPHNSPLGQRKPFRSGGEMLNSIGIKRNVNDLPKNNDQFNLQEESLFSLQEEKCNHDETNTKKSHISKEEDIFSTSEFPATENKSLLQKYVASDIADYHEDIEFQKYIKPFSEKNFQMTSHECFEESEKFSESIENDVVSCENKCQTLPDSEVSGMDFTGITLGAKLGLNGHTSLNAPKTDSPEHRAALNASRLHQTNSNFLNLMKTKLNADQHKPVLKRKITEHEEPMYAMVMKETLQEYERQCAVSIKTENESLSVLEHLPLTPVDFMDILQRKCIEVAPDIHDVMHEGPFSPLAVASEPIYADVIEKTLLDYENEKKKQERIRKLGLSENRFLHDGTIEISSPSFLGILEDNMLQNNLLLNEESDSFNEENEPICALVIKLALKWYRKTVIHKGSNKISAGQGNVSNLSRSPSDASSTSEEVRAINTNFTNSSPQTCLENRKPALPRIPSPDYTCDFKRQVSINELPSENHNDVPNNNETNTDKTGQDSLKASNLSNEKKPDEIKSSFESHPYHIERPFWNEAVSNEPLQGEKVKRSSLKKKNSDAKSNSVSFFKNVEVIDELEELNKDGVVRREEPLKGSPQSDLRNVKRKKTPYTNIAPIDRVDTNIAPVDKDVHEADLVDHSSNNESCYSDDTKARSHLTCHELTPAEHTATQPVISCTDFTGVVQSVQLTEEDLLKISEEQNISLEDVKGGGLMYNLVFDLVTTTYPNGRVTTKLVPQGQGEKFVSDILLKEKLRESKVSVLPDANTPPPLVNRSIKPRNISTKKSHTSSNISPTNVNVDIRHGKENLLRTIIPSPDYLTKSSSDFVEQTGNEIDSDLGNHSDSASQITSKKLSEEDDGVFIKSTSIRQVKNEDFRSPGQHISSPTEKKMMNVLVEYGDYGDQNSPQNVILKTDQSVKNDITDLHLRPEVLSNQLFKTIARNDHNPDGIFDNDESHSKVLPPHIPDRSKKPVKKPCLVSTPIIASPLPRSPSSKDQLVIVQFSPVPR